VGPGDARHLGKRCFVILERIERGTASVMKPVWTAALWCSLARVFDVPIEFLFTDVRRRETDV